MNDIDKKLTLLLQNLGVELSALGSSATIYCGETITEDTRERYHTVNIRMEEGVEFICHSSSNVVGIKTFLQGLLVMTRLMTGNYKLKPTSELARSYEACSIIPRIFERSMGGAPVTPRFAEKRIRLGEVWIPRETYLHLQDLASNFGLPLVQMVEKAIDDTYQAWSEADDIASRIEGQDLVIEPV